MLRPIGLLLILSGTLSAQNPPATPPGAAPNAAAAQGAPQQRPGPRPFAEVTKGAESAGFFDTYEKDDKVWIAVPRERSARTSSWDEARPGTARTALRRVDANPPEANVATSNDAASVFRCRSRRASPADAMPP
jgi:hypothetical protein